MKMNVFDIAKKFGDAFYVLHTERFAKNFCELKNEFEKIYPHFNIAYSYKTNYTPRLCKKIDELGGLAEVVSDMELEIALRSGVNPEKIIWNGPFKNYSNVEKLLKDGGTINLDSAYEIPLIEEIAKKYPERRLNLGIRCNFEINDGVLSRFGFDTQSEDFANALSLFKEHKNLHLKSMQCHFATRSLKTWAPRTQGMISLIKELGVTPEYIDLGGGLFGKMAPSLAAQFDTEIPNYADYANAVAPLFAKHFDGEYKPTLLVEPGSALVGDCMSFVCRVVNIKNVRGKAIATLQGSIYNINPTLNKKNPPITIHSGAGEKHRYTDLDFGGFTCIESDYLYRGFDGELAVGDMVEFGNVGSYSVVLKPPFILPNFPVIELDGENVREIKKAECFDDIFHTFVF